jgi:hypothetical protein
MTTIDVKFSPKRPEDIEWFSINFARLLGADAIQTAVVTSESIKGPSAGAAGMVQGEAKITDTAVSVLVGGGQAGATYGLRFKVDTASGQHLELVGSLDVSD